jgi:type IV secretory pathway VirB10-like protein
VWNRLILPDGRLIILERLPAADPQGYAGLEDRVDYHWGRVAKAAILSTILGIGAELGNSSSNPVLSGVEGDIPARSAKAPRAPSIRRAIISSAASSMCHPPSPSSPARRSG